MTFNCVKRKTAITVLIVLIAGGMALFATANASACFFSDFDRDGLTDGLEIFVFYTDPTNADTDGDGLKDGDEVLTYGTNPTNADTDGDTLGDALELYLELKATDADTDGDGMWDGYELTCA